jgi:hypothetical protein
MMDQLYPENRRQAEAAEGYRGEPGSERRILFFRKNRTEPSAQSRGVEVRGKHGKEQANCEKSQVRKA